MIITIGLLTGVKGDIKSLVHPRFVGNKMNPCQQWHLIEAGRMPALSVCFYFKLSSALSTIFYSEDVGGSDSGGGDGVGISDDCLFSICLNFDQTDNTANITSDQKRVGMTVIITMTGNHVTYLSKCGGISK